jgi:leucyl-tRNA synthetase
LIKIEIVDQKKEELFNTTKKVYLVAATLRPETMYGQTNCFVLPEGDYGIFEMPKDEIWICSDRSMLNMAYQDLTIEPKKTNLLSRVIG